MDSVNGAKIYFAIKTPLGDINITQTTISILAVTVILLIIAKIAT